jgi:signal transduction histidine kinase
MDNLQVVLVSKDPDLRSLCQEVFAELVGNCTLDTAAPGNLPPSGDLYIWDFHPAQPSPQNIAGQPLWRNLFLVDRKDLPAFRQRNISPEMAVLLKPATRVTLSAFLGHSLPACAREGGHAASAMCTGCDELLNCLIHTNLKLQEYDQDRTNFLARAVHDFRAPLTALSGYCGLLLAEPLGPLNNDQREVLKRMERSAKRLSRMASAMFQLSIGGKVKAYPNLEQGDLQECMDQALHELAPFIEEKNIEVSVDLASPPLPLYFDKSQIEQVLLNLLENACKFTPKRGSIAVTGYSFFWDRRCLNTRSCMLPAERRVRSCQTANSFRLDIRDTGPGIQPTHLDSIFEEYTRYAGTQDRSGGGLGLAICKMLLNAHRGRIWAEPSDSGAVFSLVLPFRAAEPKQLADMAELALA